MSDTPRTVLITGATEGIGHEVAHRLAAYGATVILHARTRRDGEEAVDRLVKAGADPLRLHAVAADFCRLREVTALAEQVAAEHRASTC